MSGNLTMKQLEAAVDAGEIDTVITATVDMQGRLMGKRFHARHFLESGFHETHGCNYILATDIEMTTVPGYAATGWAQGYGDYIHKPDLATLRLVPWMPATAMVICDFVDHHTGEEVPHAPRSILKRQIARARGMGFEPMMATELEFYLFEESYDALNAAGYRAPTPLGRYNLDYAIMGTARSEPVMRDIRNGLFGAGIPVECSKGEADAGQQEVNIRYADALTTADNHSIIKNAIKEIALGHGHSATFMAKYATSRAGSSSHVHQSLSKDGAPAFHDASAEHGMSVTMRQYLAGCLEHAGECTLTLAPYINSYKRFCTGMFAPTKAVWSTDNRTAGFRVCGADTKGVRVECRIGGADLNPYLALAAQLAAGLSGIETGMTLEDEYRGDIYQAGDARSIPVTLRESAAAFHASAMLRAAFGDDVVEHYTRAAQWEITELDRCVTDWDKMRGFERT
jgi:glutamine synthetase